MKELLQPGQNGPPSDIYSIARQELGGSRRRAAYLACGLMLLFWAYWMLFHPFRGEKDLLIISYDASGAYLKTVCSSYEAEAGGNEGELISQQAGSVQQAENIARGLVADVLLLATRAEMLQIGESAQILEPNWDQRYPYGSSPFTSTVVMVERVEAAHETKEWADLYQARVRSVMPDPRTSGAGRYIYLALLADALERTEGDSRMAAAHVCNLMMRIRMVPLGAHSVSEVFVQNSQEDVLITWENEALRIVNALAPGKFRIVYPSSSILAEPVVAVLEGHAKSRGTTETAHRFVEFLFSEKGQELAGEAGLRPRSRTNWTGGPGDIELKRVDEVFGEWGDVYKEHLGPGGSFSYAMRMRAALKGGAE